MLKFSVRYRARNRSRTKIMGPSELIELCKAELFGGKVPGNVEVIDFSIVRDKYRYAIAGFLGDVLVDYKAIPKPNSLTIQGEYVTEPYKLRSYYAPPIVELSDLEPFLVYTEYRSLHRDTLTWEEKHYEAYDIIYQRYPCNGNTWIDENTVVQKDWENLRFIVSSRDPAINQDLIDALKQEFEGGYQDILNQARAMVKAAKLNKIPPSVREELRIDIDLSENDLISRLLRKKEETSRS